MTVKEPLLPDRHRQLDFFVCNVLDPRTKNDLSSMEHPCFMLSTKLKREIFRYENNGCYIEIAPSAYGYATQFDKDVLIFCLSHLVEGLNRGRTDVSRTVRFVAYDFLLFANRQTSGDGYKRLQLALDRLKGTSIKTNVPTAGETIRRGFGIIDDYEIVERSPINNQMIAIEVTLSRWFFNAVCAHEVLTLSQDYFRLRKPLERRIYEIARKHCGRQESWKVSLKMLHAKTGSTGLLKEFRRSIKQLHSSNHLPDYEVEFLSDEDLVLFQRRK